MTDIGITPGRTRALATMLAFMLGAPVPPNGTAQLLCVVLAKTVGILK